MSTAAARSYHHGDLRNALIIAAAELIEESGSLNFAMADAARRAGVSTAAPYRHFRDKDALLEAVTQLAFFGLGEAARVAVEKERIGSIEAVIAMGRVYIDYVTSRAAFYDLMWGDIGSRAMESDSFDRNAAGFYQLVSVVSAYLREQDLEAVDPLETSIQLWAMVHGTSAIAMSGKLEHFHPDADLHQLMERASRAFLRGLRAEP